MVLSGFALHDATAWVLLAFCDSRRSLYENDEHAAMCNQLQSKETSRHDYTSLASPASCQDFRQEILSANLQCTMYCWQFCIILSRNLFLFLLMHGTLDPVML